MPSVENLVTDNLDLWTSAIKTKTSVGRGSSKKRELYGIKKLRDLILELAVRGLLVPQDPSDEPASELLKRIAQAKLKLIKDGEIKKPKEQPSIGKNEKLFEIPEHWRYIRLGEIVSIVRGITFPASAKQSEPANGLVPCLRTANVQHEIEWSDLIYVAEKYVKRKDQYLCIGDIVMSMANSRELVGKVSFASNIPVKLSSFGGFLGVIRPIELSPGFLMSILRAPNIRANLIGSASQTTNIANISLEKLNPLVIAVPPIQEQHRIVAKVEELMALCNQLEQQTETRLDAHQTLVETLLGTLTNASNSETFNEAWQRIAEHFDTLFTTEHSIDQLKQTILQLAAMGKLVPQDPNDEPANELLQRIADEKERLVKAGKIKKQKPLLPIEEDEKPFELPKGWEWVNLNDVFALITDGDHQAPPKADTGIPFLVIGNLNTGTVAFDGCRHVPESYYHKLDWGKKPVLGDLLYTVTGSYGIPIQILTDKRFCVQRHVAILKAINSTPVSYISLLLKSKYAFKFATAIATGIAQKTVPLTGLRKLPVAIAPEQELRRIVVKVEKLLNICDEFIKAIKVEQAIQFKLASTLTKLDI